MTDNGLRVALVNPPLKNVITGATPDYVNSNRGCMPPLGLLYLQAALEGSHHESTFVDANLNGWTHEETARRIHELNVDVVGIQAMTFTMPDAYQLACSIKAIDKNINVVIGGPHPTIYPKETAALDAVDYAFAGEGEHRFAEFLDAIGDLQSMSQIHGVAYEADGSIEFKPTTGMIADLDSIPLPARKASRFKEYGSILSQGKVSTVMITSRGCPFNCIFCNRMGRTWRSHSAEYVLNEIAEIVDLGIKEIFIHDDTFTIKRDRIVKICEGIIDKGYDIVWEARSRVDCVDKDLLKLMSAAGCRRMSFGVESGSPRVLKAMRKDIDLEIAESVFSWCRETGIVTLADFIFGNLDETDEDIQLTMNCVKRIKPNYVQYSICSPYPETPLYKLGLEKGLIDSDIWVAFAKDPIMEFKSPVWTQNYSEAELVELTRKAYKKFYVKPAFILKQALKITSFSQLKDMASAAIGMMRK